MPSAQKSNRYIVTAESLDAGFRPFTHRLPFPRNRDSAAWQEWRVELRQRLREILLLDKLGDVPTPVPEIIRTEDCGNYIRHTIEYETLPNTVVPAFLLVPKSEPEQKPAMICPHGHVESCAEAVIDPEKAKNGVAYGHDLAARGMVVLAPYNAGNGVRDVDSEKFNTTGCELLFRRLNHLGLDVTGFRIFELMAGLNILQAREDVDGDRIGAAGLSGGCWLSHVLTALDERVKAAILSSFFTSFEQTVWFEHCLCHHPKGIGEICELYDLAALIAPRPLFVESGIHDTGYPIEPAFSYTREAYRLLDAESNLQLDRYEGMPGTYHMFHGKHSIPWIVDKLNKP